MYVIFAVADFRFLRFLDFFSEVHFSGVGNFFGDFEMFG